MLGFLFTACGHVQLGQGKGLPGAMSKLRVEAVRDKSDLCFTSQSLSAAFRIGTAQFCLGQRALLLPDRS